MRVTAVVEVFAGMAAAALQNGLKPDPLNLSSCVLSGLALLLLYPMEHDSLELCWRCFLIASICCGAALLLPLQPAIAALVDCFLLVAFEAFYMFSRFSNVKSFISNVAVWHNIEDSDRLVLTLAYMLLAMLAICMEGARPLFGWLALALLFAAFIFRYIQIYCNMCIFFKKEEIKEIKHHLRGRVQPASPLRSDDEISRISALYDRVIKLMEEKQPYLDPELKITTLSAMLFTNKVYLSRTINVMSGLNFNQFVNSYRVAYAKDLMRKDFRLQVQEVATMSGFQTAASLNMAFKLFEGMTPGKFVKSVSESPSKMMGREP